VKLDVKPKERSVIKTEPGKGKIGRVNVSESSMRLRDWYSINIRKMADTDENRLRIRTQRSGE
jgi:hypothetical protein